MIPRRIFVCIHYHVSTTPLSVNFILLVVTVIVLITLLLRGIIFSFSLFQHPNKIRCAFGRISCFRLYFVYFAYLISYLPVALFPFSSPLSRAFSLVLFSFLIFYPRSMSILASLFITSSSSLMCSLSLSLFLFILRHCSVSSCRCTRVSVKGKGRRFLETISHWIWPTTMYRRRR